MHFDLAKYFKNLYLAEAEELPKGKWQKLSKDELADYEGCLLYTSPSPRDRQKSRMPSSA